MNIKQAENDYKKVASAEHKKRFVFYPDTSVTNPGEFILALYEFANSQNAEIEILKEGMYPEFSLDGIEYTAERYYTTIQRVPMAVIRCTALHPEDFEADVEEKRKKLLKSMHYGWIAVIFVVALLSFGVFLPNSSLKEMLSSWEGIVILISGVVMAGVSTFLYCFFHYNEK